MDREELIEKIAEAIHSAEYTDPFDKIWEPLKQNLRIKAEAALSVIEEAGFLCQANGTAKGDAGSHPADALQSGEGVEALDRGLPRQLSIHFAAGDDGLLHAFSDDIPEFYLSGTNHLSVLMDVGPVLRHLLRKNYDTNIVAFCQRPIEDRSDTTTAPNADDSLTPKNPPASPEAE